MPAAFALFVPAESAVCVLEDYFMANPDLIQSFKRGGPFAHAPKYYWYDGGALGYSDWPSL
jgi:hypothetical protein